MATVEIKLRKPVVEGKLCSIYYRIAHKSKESRIATPYKLYPAEWNERSQIINISGRDCDYLLNIQEQLANDLNKINQIIRTKERSCNTYSAKDITFAFKESSSDLSLSKYINDEIARLNKEGKLGTAANYLRTERSLSKFLNGENLQLSACTESLVLDYEKWLKRRGLTRNTTSFYMRALRSIYNKAASEVGVVQGNPFRRVYTGVDRTHNRAIQDTFIIKLCRLNLDSSPRLRLTRDMFIFSFYTRGMSFVDMAFLRKNDIHNGVIQYIRRKTGKYMCIQIEECMRDIVEAYDSSSSPYIFPVITSDDDAVAYRQYQSALNGYNRNLKKLGAAIQAPVPLSSYIARHTWATMARNYNIPISVISAGMGHSSEKTTQIYLDSLDESIIDEANKLVISNVRIF